MRSQASLLLPWLPGEERRQGKIQSQDQGEPSEGAPAEVAEVQAVPLPPLLDLDRKMPVRIRATQANPTRIAPSIQQSSSARLIAGCTQFLLSPDKAIRNPGSKPCHSWFPRTGSKKATVIYSPFHTMNVTIACIIRTNSPTDWAPSFC